jgi:DNA-binding NtrC family response regulator
MEANQRRTIMEMLKEAHGNKVKAANRLGIGRQTLYDKIRDYGIPE